MKEAAITPPPANATFVVCKYTGQNEKGNAYTQSLIALKENGIITCFTGLERAATAFIRSNIRHISASNETPLMFDSQFLNYLVSNNGLDPREAPFGFDIEDMQVFFEYYALEGTRTDPTICQCICSVSAFAAGLAKMYPGVLPFTPDSLYTEHEGYRYGRTEKYLVPVFQVNTINLEKDTFRELPLKVLAELIGYAFRKDPSIAFAICLQSFGGLREGEVMNVRQESSCLGPGLRITMHGSRINRAEIDLLGNYCLRKDGLRTGSIKRNRPALIYPALLPAFEAAYRFHLQYLAGCTYDKKLAPMFVDSNGNAMTSKTYRRRVQALVESFRREVLSCSSDSELKSYGLLLKENDFVPHSFRHAFSVFLVFMGEGVEGIMSYRGDRCPDSALHYLQRKEELVRSYKDSQRALATMFLNVIP